MQMFYLGGGFRSFLFLPLTWGDDLICRAHFSDGLVQPPTTYSYVIPFPLFVLL